MPSAGELLIEVIALGRKLALGRDGGAKQLSCPRVAATYLFVWRSAATKSPSSSMPTNAASLNGREPFGLERDSCGSDDPAAPSEGNR